MSHMNVWPHYCEFDTTLAENKRLRQQQADDAELAKDKP